MAERIERIHPGNGIAIYVSWSSPLTDELAPTILSDTLVDGPAPDLIIDSPHQDDFAYVCRKVKKADVYFITNLGNHAASAELRLSSVGRVEHWDPSTGEIEPVTVYRRVDSQVWVPWTYSPGGAVSLVVTPEEETDHVDATDSCEMVKIADGQAEIRVNAPKPYLTMRGERIRVPEEPPFPPLKVPHDWRVERDGPNSWPLDRIGELLETLRELDAVVKSRGFVESEL